MSDPSMTMFFQFIERLQAAGWEPSGDAQWEGAKALYDELIAPRVMAPVPTASAEALRAMLPKLALWGWVTEEVIGTHREAFVTGYREGLGDGLVSRDDAEEIRAQKYAEDLRVVAATVAATNGHVRAR